MVYINLRDSRHMLPTPILVPITSSIIPSSPLAGRGDFFGLFGLKGVGSKNFWIKGEPKFALQNFEVSGSVLVEQMHTSKQKSTIFSKKYLV